MGYFFILFVWVASQMFFELSTVKWHTSNISKTYVRQWVKAMAFQGGIRIKIVNTKKTLVPL